MWASKISGCSEFLHNTFSFFLATLVVNLWFKGLVFEVKLKILSPLVEATEYSSRYSKDETNRIIIKHKDAVAHQ